MNPTENQFLKELDKRLWTAADKLHSNLDAAVYKHVVLGLIFLKYVSDIFNEQRNELIAIKLFRVRASFAEVQLLQAAQPSTRYC
jgi:type I restriction-modification system DNA methylase subunit